MGYFRKIQTRGEDEDMEFRGVLKKENVSGISRGDQ